MDYIRFVRFIMLSDPITLLDLWPKELNTITYVITQQ